ncbi:hypothetical protein [Dactylosporangium sp. NPDC005555]|uniref:hypothetical protein n=1 Tax=Dactylosporangium sp. NPDC005555 TaxID=3154889 RepID=UPI00339F77F2
MNPFGLTVGNRLAEQLVPRLLTPAFAFWAGGLLALWTPARGHRWSERIGALSGVEQVALLAAAVSLIAGSAVVAELLTLPVLRLLEGYGPLTRAPRRFQRRRYEDADAQLQALSGRAFRGEPVDPLRLAAAEQRLHDFPGVDRIMPTRLGNILRAAEDRPAERYGLDPVICWPHLWLALDKDVQLELTEARRSLDDAARLWLWFLLFSAWTWTAWWAPLVSVAGCVVTYHAAMLGRARAYGQLLQAAFDLHRHLIYAALRWPVPESPDRERAGGEAVTTYLWRGIAPPGMRFTS